MSWMIEAFKELGDKMKGKKELKVPKPPQGLKAAVVLSEEELRYVPEDKKSYYMTLKENDPEIAEKKLEAWKIDAEQVDKLNNTAKEVQVVTMEELILIKLDQILERL